MKRIVILGGTGFVGRTWCEQWSARHGGGGPRLVVATRQRARARPLAVLPCVDIVQADVHDDRDLAGVLQGAEAVINLVAVLHGTPPVFERVHVALPRRLAEACRQARVPRLLHVSALGVPDGDPAQAPSHYLRSKARGEQALREAAGDAVAWTILRPSVMFGARDRFLNLFARLQALFPVMPLACADARFQPVWVEDMASALSACLFAGRTAGQVIECAGPTVLTLRELVALAGQASGHPRPIWALPPTLGRWQAAAMAWLPGEPLMTVDNLDSMQVPNVAGGRLPGLASLGIQPASVREVAPSYLHGGQDHQAVLDHWRGRARG